ncbi:alpha/beta fold hydrolase [Falsiroseomonas sp. HW251]|uniref:alpha/beta fold hydrolase n=1 Tax=Falsiroseomonas sp. HW251 TaxID=3390998 RepID=UPI003D31965D
MPDIIARRSALAFGFGAATASLTLRASSAAAEVPNLPAPRGKTYVLVHGAWLGGWAWAPVAERLRAANHRVIAESFTGMGERRHLLAPGVTLETWIEDLAAIIEAEELDDVILVGHSFGGLPCLGVTDRMPDRIGRLVLLDAMVAKDGQSALDVLPPDSAERIRRGEATERGVPVLPAFTLPPDTPFARWLMRHVAPHPKATYEAPLRLAREPGAGRPRTYVALTGPADRSIEPSRQAVRALGGWEWAEIAAPHGAPMRNPDEVAALLAGLG